MGDTGDGIERQAPYRLSICGKHELDRFVENGVTHLLSLEDPGTVKRTPMWFLGEHWQLHFHDLDTAVFDVLPGTVAPSRTHVKQILGVGQRCMEVARERPVHLLVHCYAGVSRSPAAALALWHQALGPRSADQAFRYLGDARPGAMPNRLIVEFADQLLNGKGEMLKALRFYRRSQGLCS